MRSHLIIWVLLVLLMVTLPYILAAIAGGEGFVFGGFLINPLDGNSYLAKMNQGWQGEWRFTLPFTAKEEKGAYLFLFYIALGHLARWLHLPLLWTFHLARLLAGICLMLALWRFLKAFPPEIRPSWMIFPWLVLGSGLGWLAYLFGAFTSDFWVAEAYPFLSMYANPHFPLGIALLLWLFTLPEARQDKARSFFFSKPFGRVYLPLVGDCSTFWRNHRFNDLGRVVRVGTIIIAKTN